MARWLRDDNGIPAELSEPGWAGWRAACLAWLAAHPGGCLPFGQYGDSTDVFKLAREYRLENFAQPAEIAPARGDLRTLT